MKIEKILDKLKDLILTEVKKEFRLFKAEVRGELAGYRLAIESLNARVGNIESENTFDKKLADFNKRINDTNKRIDELRVELKQEIMLNT